MTIERTAWGSMPDGSKVTLFTLSNARGMRASISNYGATLVGLEVPDRNGAMADVVLGYDDLDSYRRDPTIWDALSVGPQGAYVMPVSCSATWSGVWTAITVNITFMAGATVFIPAYGMPSRGDG